MKLLDWLKQPSKTVIRKHLHAAIDELVLELELAPTLAQKERMERALYDLYMVALRSNNSIDRLNKDKEVSNDTIVDALNRVNYLQSKLREELKKHPALTKLDSGTMVVYVEESMEFLDKLNRVLAAKVRS